jgi:hypothetical protein
MGETFAQHDMFITICFISLFTKWTGNAQFSQERFPPLGRKGALGAKQKAGTGV